MRPNKPSKPTLLRYGNGGTEKRATAASTTQCGLTQVLGGRESSEVADGIIDLVFGALEVAVSWRSAVLTLVGLGVGLAYFYGSGEEPSSAAIAFGLSLTGLVAGVAWHLAVRTRR
jgi:hypothetical protein